MPQVIYKIINPAIEYRNQSSPLVGDLSLFPEGFQTSRNDKIRYLFAEILEISAEDREFERIFLLIVNYNI